MKKSIAFSLGLFLLAALVFTGCPSPADSTPQDAEAPVITRQPEGALYREGEAAALSVEAEVSDGGELSYQWYVYAGDDAEPTAVDHATGSTYSPPTAETGATLYRVKVSNTNTGVSGVKTAETFSDTAEITVIPADAGTGWSVTANGVNGTETTTVLAFIFDEDAALTKDAIDVTDGTGSVTTGNLTGGGKTWSLEITVTKAGSVKVTINGVEKAVTVYKAGAEIPGEPAITYSVSANGTVNTTNTTGITFTFSGDVTLTKDIITVTDGTGSVTTGSLTGSGKTWMLALTGVAAQGTVTVSINKEGIESNDKTVRVYKNLALTKDIRFTYTAKDSSGTTFDPSGWEGDETPAETWTLGAVEQGTVYFAVEKEAAQTITVGGADAGKVTQGTADGSTAGPTLGVFTVDTRDLVFDGGARTFTLGVAEDGVAPKTVTVTLKVEPHLTGAAVFRVAWPQTPAAPYADLTDAVTLIRLDTARGTPTGNIPAEFTALLDAIAWVDRNTMANTDYLIRVEQDVTDLPRIYFTGRNVENITVRLRGTKNGPWILGNNDFPPNDARSVYYNSAIISSSSVGSGTTPVGVFFHIGGSNITNKITFVLENNIIVKGIGKGSPSQSKSYCSLFQVTTNATLVMKKGSTISEYTATKEDGNFCPVYITVSSNNTSKDPRQHGHIRIEGGAITDCTFNTGKAHLIGFSSGENNISAGAFYKAESTPDNPILIQDNSDTVVYFNVGASSNTTFYDISGSAEISKP
ncbi:MAG: hypothetical protein LBB98_02945 [Treponema sp.]|jgi:hypothetical protein|nr:hypothetical protein [Treponema sp.]